MRIWDVGSGALLRTITGAGTNPSAVVYSPDGKVIATSSWDLLQLWHADTGRPRATLERTGTLALAFSADGSTLATAATGNTVQLWSVRRHEPTAVLAGHRGVINA
ncbi:MAG: hypothetical protein KC457_36860, partial [Myxococcales bacterium]|nr:hypothetical protein [Myxococcales bacterium]